LFRLEIMNRRRILLILGAIFFGALAWLSVSMGEQYQLTLTAPLTIVDVPRGWAIRTPVPPTIQLRYHGDGWRLALLQFGAEPHLEIPFPSLRQASFDFPLTDSLAPSNRVLDIPPRIITQFDIVELAPMHTGVQLVDVKPDSIYLALDRREERKLPVILDMTTMFREGYGQVGEATVTPESVMVAGAASNVRALDSWRTARTVLEDLRAPVDTDVPLAATTTMLLTVFPPAVHVTVNVQPFAEKVLSGVPIEGTDIPENREIIFIPPKLDIVARGGIKQLATLVPGDFRITVDYRSIVADTTGSVDPIVVAPSGIQVVTKRPDRLQYIVRKRL
jgi:hypothetical protein